MGGTVLVRISTVAVSLHTLLMIHRVNLETVCSAVAFTFEFFFFSFILETLSSVWSADATAPCSIKLDESMISWDFLFSTNSFQCKIIS